MMKRGWKRHPWKNHQCTRCGARRRRAGKYGWRYSVDGYAWGYLSSACGSPAPVPVPDLDRIARELVTALYLYPGYTVGSRGPSGCIMDALAEVAPDVAAEIREGVELGDIFQRRWPEP